MHPYMCCVKLNSVCESQAETVDMNGVVSRGVVSHGVVSHVTPFISAGMNGVVSLVMRCVAVYCSVLQCVAVCCSVLRQE